MPKPRAEVVTAEKFTMSANADANDAQANVTYMLKAKGEQTLGTGGEQVSFAKYSMEHTINALAEIENPAEREAKGTKVAPALEAVADMMEARNDILEVAVKVGAGKSPEPDKISDFGLITRSVASSEVDRLFNANVTAEERFGQDAEKKPIGLSVQVDGAGVQSEYRVDGPQSEKVNCRLDVDYKDPQIQKGLCDLEAMDYITGQYDRHPGNIYIDPANNKVTGIDNDLAFPEVDRATLVQRRRAECKAVQNPPMFMHEDTANKIMAVTPDQLEQHLRNMPVPPGASPLSEAAIMGARQRLEEMQANIVAARNGQPSPTRIVQHFDDDTYQQMVDAQDQRVDAYNTNLGNPLRANNIPASGREGHITGAGVTSYVGAVRQNELLFKLSEVQNPGDPGIKLRPADSALPAQRNSRAVLKQMADLENEIKELKNQAAKYENRSEAPSVKDKLRGFLPGKSDDRIAARNLEKRDELLNKAALLQEKRGAIIMREAGHAQAAVVRNQAANQQPAVNHNAPAVNENAPAVNENAPAVNENAPAVNENAPAANLPQAQTWQAPVKPAKAEVPQSHKPVLEKHPSIGDLMGKNLVGKAKQKLAEGAELKGSIKDNLPAPDGKPTIGANRSNNVK